MDHPNVRFLLLILHESCTGCYQQERLDEGGMDSFWTPFLATSCESRVIWKLKSGKERNVTHSLVQEVPIGLSLFLSSVLGTGSHGPK